MDNLSSNIAISLKINKEGSYSFFSAIVLLTNFSDKIYLCFKPEQLSILSINGNKTKTVATTINTNYFKYMQAPNEKIDIVCDPYLLQKKIMEYKLCEPLFLSLDTEKGLKIDGTRKYDVSYDYDSVSKNKTLHREVNTGSTSETTKFFK